MIEQIRHWVELGGSIIQYFAVIVIIAGFLLATIAYFTERKSSGGETAFDAFRRQMGMSLLLGLEILVIADVIETISVPPSYQSLAALAFLVVIRTVISWSTSLQMNGRWPWQPDHNERARDG